MAKEKFYFDQQTLSYEQVEISWRSKLRRFFLFFLSSAFTGLIMFVLFSTAFASPREKDLMQEKRQMEIQYTLLAKQVDEMGLVMRDMQQRDDNLYRAIFQADPIPYDIRSGKSVRTSYYSDLFEQTNSEIVADLTNKVDILKRQMYVQSKSYDETVKIAQKNETKLQHIPAIQPVLNKDLKRMASGYGWRIDPVYHVRKFHHGMDFSAPTGTDVYATGNARVSFSGWKSGYGNTVMLDHGYGYVTLYAHLSKQLVTKGQEVKRGDVIALVGNTGKSTGSHLHYEVRYKNRPTNPQNYYFKDLSPEQYDQMVQMASNAGRTLD